MNPDDPVLRARIDMAAMVAQMAQIAGWLQVNGNDWPDPVKLFVSVTLITIRRYAQSAVQIINQPSVERPVMGRRCIFY